MHTMFDFTTHVKTVEYVLALASIAGYIVFWEILKPRPFKTLVETGSDDIKHIKSEGYEGNKRLLMNMVSAAMTGAIYLATVPLAFAMATLFKVFGESATFGWSPVEAYLAGRRTKSRGKDKK